MLDCPSPRALAEFYRLLLGGTVNQPDPRWATSDAFATLHSQDSRVYAFQQVQPYVAPQWPDPLHPQQFHLDIDVLDLDDAARRVLAAGATMLKTDGRGWQVFADPAGHPFCLLRSA